MIPAIFGATTKSSRPGRIPLGHNRNVPSTQAGSRADPVALYRDFLRADFFFLATAFCFLATGFFFLAGRGFFFLAAARRPPKIAS
jgi:hypothetical protein